MAKKRGQKKSTKKSTKKLSAKRPGRPKKQVLSRKQRSKKSSKKSSSKSRSRSASRSRSRSASKKQKYVPPLYDTNVIRVPNGASWADREIKIGKKCGTYYMHKKGRVYLANTTNQALIDANPLLYSPSGVLQDVARGECLLERDREAQEIRAEAQAEAQAEENELLSNYGRLSQPLGYDRLSQTLGYDRPPSYDDQPPAYDRLVYFDDEPVLPKTPIVPVVLPYARPESPIVQLKQNLNSQIDQLQQRASKLVARLDSTTEAEPAATRRSSEALNNFKRAITRLENEPTDGNIRALERAKKEITASLNAQHDLRKELEEIGSVVDNVGGRLARLRLERASLSGNTQAGLSY